ncbi:nucleoside triphosphate pyrophosphatase [Colwelliaceae bacterium 6441]
MNKLILASQSPRRGELLTQLGYQFSACPADIDESEKKHETPVEYVARLAFEKAQCIAKNQAKTTVVLGSDTCVVKDGKILGKPEDLAQCIEHLSMLSASTHQVFTAIAVVQGELSKTLVISTDVEFKALSTSEIERYWQTGEPQDKAGSYGIQGIAGQFVKQIKGSYSAVVGLPLYETAQLLAEFSLPTPIQR